MMWMSNADLWLIIVLILYAVGIVGLVFILFPFLVFLVVKIGTYAYYKGRELWKNEQENKNG